MIPKFRIYDKIHRRMIYPDEIMFQHDHIYTIEYEKELCDRIEQSIPHNQCIIMPFTGLVDGRFNIDIYQYDFIVQDRYPFFDDGELCYVAMVDWIYSSWQYVKYCVNPKKRGISSGINEHFDDSDGSEWIVDGNIFDLRNDSDLFLEILDDNDELRIALER